MNKNGGTIASAITNLDIHDIARISKTYCVKKFYIVNPLKDQKELLNDIVKHWITGNGAKYNPKRKLALELIDIKNSLGDVEDHIFSLGMEKPKVVATCAREFNQNINYKTLRSLIKDDKPYLLVFGTGWGLSEEIIKKADYILSPIKGYGEYNHLSVRSAVAIILDRIMRRE